MTDPVEQPTPAVLPQVAAHAPASQSQLPPLKRLSSVETVSDVRVEPVGQQPTKVEAPVGDKVIRLSYMRIHMMMYCSMQDHISHRLKIPFWASNWQQAMHGISRDALRQYFFGEMRRPAHAANAANALDRLDQGFEAMPDKFKTLPAAKYRGEVELAFARLPKYYDPYKDVVLGSPVPVEWVHQETVDGHHVVLSADIDALVAKNRLLGGPEAIMAVAFSDTAEPGAHRYDDLRSAFLYHGVRHHLKNDYGIPLEVVRFQVGGLPRPLVAPDLKSYNAIVRQAARMELAQIALTSGMWQKCTHCPFDGFCSAKLADVTKDDSYVRSVRANVNANISGRVKKVFSS